ncbi:MAG TPA: sigma 54-interacting transcriptional regulator [Pirellulales bacterium]|nr:sigma 54-interacting transcriptional regulator [Pirellulales bacterium]
MPVATAQKFAYFTMTVGGRAGEHFLLDRAATTRLGRGEDCQIVLGDPLCSRVHSEVLLDGEGRWIIRDAGSRNGTFVNGQKTDEAVLAEGHNIRVGSNEFEFHLADQPPAVVAEPQETYTNTIVRDTPVRDAGQSLTDTGVLGLAAVRDFEQAKQLLVLYQLSIKLLGCPQPDEVVRIAIELLQAQTRASIVGFLWVDDEGRLKPKFVIPEGSREPADLSDSLTELVCRKGHAVWIAKQRGSPQSDSLGHYADALCVPLVSEHHTFGAVHAYLAQGRFRQSDFDFAISLAHILEIALVRARQQSALETDYQRLVEKSSIFGQLIGDSTGMRELKSKIGRLAKASGGVLIRGESGSGKELVARAIHKASPRADRPMLCVNCAAIPHELMESQLFGHKAGAFTSADRDHIGFFQQADSGTLFLDEVGEMTLEGQAKLLRILEGHPFLPVGSSQEVTADVRIIAATNQDLQTYVRQKKFREDLYYRLSVFELVVPPLRDRGSDINLLANYFLDHFRRQHGRPHLEISAEARQKLLAYNWPGNVRQLRNVIDSAVVMAGDNRIEASDLGLHDISGAPEMETLALDYWERRLIGEALKRTGGNVPEAAKLLGIGRATLYRKIEEYGINR